MNNTRASLTMDAYRNAVFRREVIARLHQGKSTGKTPAQVAHEIAEEQCAIAKAIVTPELIDAASTALLEAQTKIAPNTRYQTLPTHAKEAMQQILQRRAADALAFAREVEQPAYYEPLAKHSPSDTAVVPTLRDIKMHDVLYDLLHLDTAGAPQVIAHIDATAKGMMLEHDELAAAFDPNGALQTPFMHALAQQLPTASEARIHTITLNWLQERHTAAKLTSDLAANDGAAYLEAVQRSREWHTKKHKSPTSTVLLHREKTPAEIEQQKTKEQHAEDVAYTINHAISCGTTDVVLQPVISAAFGVNVGCNHPDHHHPKQKLTLKSFAHEAGHYFKGEIIGDVAAVPLTIGVQRLFPNFMNGIRKLTEPLFGWAFRNGANRAAHHWAKNQGLADDAPEVTAYAEQVYQHEITHLPQAVVWNMFAYPIGAVGQKIGGHGRSYPEIFKSKLVGALVSNSILIGGRIVAPDTAQKWDTMTGENILLPASKSVGKMFGVDEETMQRAAESKHKHEVSTWEKRVEDRQQPPTEIGTP